MRLNFGKKICSCLLIGIIHQIFKKFVNPFTPRQYSPDYKLETYLKIARLFLEDEDANQADAYINRASLLQSESKNEELQILYKVCATSFDIPVNSVVNYI